MVKLMLFDQSTNSELIEWLLKSVGFFLDSMMVYNCVIELNLKNWGPPKIGLAGPLPSRGVLLPC